jgi:urea transporter
MVGLFALLTTLTYKKKIDLTVSLSIVSLCCLVAVGVQKWGIDGYQTWKLITTFTPFFMIMFLIALLSITSKGAPGSWILLSLITVGATYSWSGSIWMDQQSSYLSQDLAQITRTAEIKRQEGVNVLIEPFFETMAASVMSGVPSSMSSSSYPFFTGQDPEFACTLATEATLATLKNPGPIIARRGRYVLVGTPVCD